MRYLSIPFLGVAYLLSALAAAQDQEPACHHADLQLMAAIPVSNKRAELSGVALRGDQLFTISNEALDEDQRQYSIQVFKGEPEEGFRFVRDVLRNTRGNLQGGGF